MALRLWVSYLSISSGVFKCNVEFEYMQASMYLSSTGSFKVKSWRARNRAISFQ